MTIVKYHALSMPCRDSNDEKHGLFVEFETDEHSYVSRTVRVVEYEHGECDRCVQMNNEQAAVLFEELAEKYESV